MTNAESKSRERERCRGGEAEGETSSEQLTVIHLPSGKGSSEYTKDSREYSHFRLDVLPDRGSGDFAGSCRQSSRSLKDDQ